MRADAMSLAGLACGLVTLSLASPAGPPFGRADPTSLLAICSTCVTRYLITGVSSLATPLASICAGHAVTRNSSPTAASLISLASKWLGADSYGKGEISIKLWSSSELHVQVKFIRGLCTRRTRIFDHRIFFNAHPRSLESNHRRLLGWDCFRKHDIFPPELGVVGERAIKIKPCPAFTVAFSGQSFQYHYIGGRCRRFRAQLIYMRVLLEKSFINVIFWCSHDNLLTHLLRIVKSSFSYSSPLDTKTTDQLTRSSAVGRAT